MKNLEVTHTLRLYDADFIAKLGGLMEQEKNHYRNKNDFLTAVLKMGYEAYVKAAAGAKSSAVPLPPVDNNDDLKEIYPLLQELNKYVAAQFKKIHIDHSLSRTVMAVIYNILRSFNRDERLMPDKVDGGFYDDLPARFEKIVVNLETRFGLK